MSTDRTPPAGATPIVVTVDAAGAVLDVVGELERFGEDRERTLRRLLDLLVGEGGPPDIVPAVELADGRFADIHIVAEDDTVHFVLLDATELMEAMRHRQQSGNQIALQNERSRRASGRPPAKRALSSYGGAGALASALSGMRAPLVEIFGHTRRLECALGANPDVLRSVAAIQHAAVRLDAMCRNGLLAFGQPRAEPDEAIDSERIAAFVQEAFHLQARMQCVALDVRAPADPERIELDASALYLILTNLVVRALDGLSDETLIISIAPDVVRRRLDIEISCGHGGFDAGRFAELVTAAGTGAHLELAISRAALLQMNARWELVERQEGGYDLWLRFPFIRIDNDVP